MDEEFGKMTKKQTQAYTGMDDKEQKALYKKIGWQTKRWF